MKQFLHSIGSAVVALLFLMLITGVLYPFFVTGIGYIFFPYKVKGSLINIEQHIIGSQLIGQFFNDPKYFWGRPSSTEIFPYNAMLDSGSNRPFEKNNLEQAMPTDFTSGSASGLDPDISLKAALLQIPRIAQIRRLNISDVENLVYSLYQGRTFGVLGESRVNVLQLNLALDHLQHN